jgi:hypothetical protein
VLDAVTSTHHLAGYFEIHFGPEASLPRAEWPAPPKVRGRELAAFLCLAPAFPAASTIEAPAIHASAQFPAAAPPEARGK